MAAVRPPWFLFAMVTLLVAAVVVAVTSGRTIEAAIIGALLLGPLGMLGLWLVVLWRERNS